jgi:hypothetical protein
MANTDLVLDERKGRPCCSNGYARLALTRASAACSRARSPPALWLAVGVFIGARLQSATQPREVIVRVTSGATVVSTQVVPLH